MRYRLGLAALALGLVASSASAQTTPRLDFSGSYQFLQPMCTVSCGDYPLGWQVSAAVGVSRWLSVVGDIGLNRKTISFSMSGPIALATSTGTLTVASSTNMTIGDLLIGPRVAKQLAPAVRLFGNVLVGAERFGYEASSSFSIPEESAQLGSSLSNTSTHWAWQPGGGVDVVIAPRWAMRLGVNYRAQNISLRHGDVLVITGIVFRPFGREAVGDR